MCDATSGNGTVTLTEYAAQEHKGEPMRTMVHARFPAELAVFLKTAALTEGVSESTALRFAVNQWASTEGFTHTPP